MHSQLVLFAAFTSVLSFASQRSRAPDTPPDVSLSTRERLSPSDWASLRAAYQAARHEARSVEGGHRAWNPGQQWSTTFDGRGFTTTPDEGDWSWGLELQSYGFEGAERAVEGSASVSVEGARVSYAWGAELEEWYENDERGLEHGYTLRERPARDGDADEPLTFLLATRGGLRAQVQKGGRDVRFLSNDNAAVLTYTGLVAFDADGRDLPARVEALPGGLRLCVQDEGARYPLTIDPIAQQAYLKASNTGTDDQFGTSVAASGDTIVIGAFVEGSSATGVDGDQSTNGAPGSGAVYVFVRDGTAWSQQAYLKASNTDTGDNFGYSVSISGDTLVVGARNEDSNATGVDGDQSDDSITEAGAAYVFVRNGTTWAQEAYLKASNTASDTLSMDLFGNSVSISGDTVVVGAVAEDSNATGIDGDGSNNSAPTSGAAYVFVRNGTSWSQQAYLKASNTDLLDAFGHSVSVSGETLVVGARFESSNATGVDGDQTNNSALWAGAAYVFVRSGTTWSQQAYLKASNTDAHDAFGGAVSASGDTVVVTAFGESSNATGVDGDQSNDSAGASGAAYAFVRNGTTWSQQAYLKASNTGTLDFFGTSVSISGDTLAVGAYQESSNATGIDGDQDNDLAQSAGAAYLFARNGTTWSQLAYLKASNTDAVDKFGWSVSVSGDTLVVGAPEEASNATGVNGDQSDDSAPRAGAAYVFDLDAPEPGIAGCFSDGSGTVACPCNNDGDPGTGGGCTNGAPMPAGQGAVLSASGSNSVSADDLVLTASFTTNQPGLFFQGQNAINGGNGVAFGDGLRCCGQNVVRLEIADPTGTNGPHTTSTTQPILGTSPANTTTAGDSRCYQWWYRNPGRSLCGSNFNLSNSVIVTWTP